MVLTGKCTKYLLASIEPKKDYFLFLEFECLKSETSMYIEIMTVNLEIQ